MHRFIVFATIALLVGSFVTAIAWVVFVPSYESTFTCLSILAAITGLVADRWVNEWERRHSLLQVLMHELLINLNVLKSIKAAAKDRDPTAPRVFPRFILSSLESVISSGAFATTADAQLWKLMHVWLQCGSDANHRMQITENLTFRNNSVIKEIHETLESGAVMKETSSALIDLTNCLVKNYSRESGIERNTKLFPPTEPPETLSKNP